MPSTEKMVHQNDMKTALHFAENICCYEKLCPLIAQLFMQYDVINALERYILEYRDGIMFNVVSFLSTLHSKR